MSEPISAHCLSDMCVARDSMMSNSSSWLRDRRLGSLDTFGRGGEQKNEKQMSHKLRQDNESNRVKWGISSTWLLMREKWSRKKLNRNTNSRANIANSEGGWELSASLCLWITNNNQSGTMTLIVMGWGACTAGRAVNSLLSTQKMEGDPLAGQRCQSPAKKTGLQG